MKLLFLDLETTGLSPRQHCIIEVAAQLCDPIGNGDLRVVDEFHSLVKPDLGAAAKASTQAMDMHRSSGLFERALDAKNGKMGVEKRLCEWVDGLSVPKSELIIAGNTVGKFDCHFLELHMPRIFDYTSHRVCDVSSLRIGIWAATGKDPLTFKKNRAHTAVEDLGESRKEMEHYIQNHLG